MAPASPPLWCGSCTGLALCIPAWHLHQARKRFVLLGWQQSTGRATWWWRPAWPRCAEGQARHNFSCPDTIFLGKWQPTFGGISEWLILLGTFCTRSLQVMAPWQRKLERRAHFWLGYNRWRSLPTALPKVLVCVVCPQKLYLFAFHRILTKARFTWFISNPTSNTAVIQSGSQVAVRSTESWVVEPRKCSFSCKPETILYCSRPVFFFPVIVRVVPNSTAVPTLEIPLCFATFPLLHCLW